MLPEQCSVRIFTQHKSFKQRSIKIIAMATLNLQRVMGYLGSQLLVISDHDDVLRFGGHRREYV